VDSASAITEHGQLQSVFVADTGTRTRSADYDGQRNQDQVEAALGVTAGDNIMSRFPRICRDRRATHSRYGRESGTQARSGGWRFCAGLDQDPSCNHWLSLAQCSWARSPFGSCRARKSRRIYRPHGGRVRSRCQALRHAKWKKRVTKPMEKLLWEIPGVELPVLHLQSRHVHGDRSLPVGQDEERASCG
jgi:hypothetical protein